MAVFLEEIVQSLELWLNLIKKPQPYVNPNLDPVLLVPGIAGSILNAVDDNGNEERVWVRLLGADYKFRTKLWSCFDSSTGQTVSLDPKTRIVVPEDRYGLFAIDGLDPDMIIGCDSVYYFHDMIVEMIKWGFQEGETLFGFGYDFRQSNSPTPLKIRFTCNGHIICIPAVLKNITTCIPIPFLKNFHSLSFHAIPSSSNHIARLLQTSSNSFLESWVETPQYAYSCSSIRFRETMERFAAKLKSVYTASGGKKLNIISHSMGGLLVKCFMCLHSDIFEKYVKNWIAIAAPFRGAPGYITSALLNGASFVEGWEQNFFISKWSMHQLLIECPSIYELMACPNFDWQTIPLLEIWREKHVSDDNSNIMLESYAPQESILILKEALSSNTVNYDGVDIPLPLNLEILKWANETQKVFSCAKVPPQVKFFNIYGTHFETPHSICYGSEQTPITDLQQLALSKHFKHIFGDLLLFIVSRADIMLASDTILCMVSYFKDQLHILMFFSFYQAKYLCVDGDGTVPMESAKADGLNAEARVGVPGDHRGIICDRHVFRILKHWLKAGDPDPFYNPLNDYVILPTAFEMEKHREEGLQVTSLKEEWEIISEDQDNQGNMDDKKPLVSSISVSCMGKDQSSRAEARATVIVHPQCEGKQHVELRAVSVSMDDKTV
ncbi:hypothetical protein HHK36_004688 [Tetracentron sinense]|uniref:Uncharacterized protein n=1 Tax=Tetracentron sinense TaxID=13715 RepID=A0A834ZN64_TETSI|nr:hypothetical protein HHK36_004688 [Tetracentron sinense]